ncbi:MAG: hypothetical protein Q9164_007398 [Protoblastenia rupestris]
MPFTSPSFVPSLPFDPPDSVPVSDFFFGEHEQQYRRHPLSESKPPFTCGVTGKSYSAPEVKSRVEWLATALAAELGWAPNEGSDFDKVVAIYSINTIDTLTVSWATHRVGGTSAPISPAYTAEDVRNQLAAVGAKAVFTCVTLLSLTLDAAAAVGIPPSHVYLLEIPQQVSAGLSAPHHIKTVDQLIHDGKSRNIIETVQWSGGRGAEQVAYLCASSGTSGFPKTVKISHRNVIANAMQHKTYESQWHKKEPELCLGLLPQSHSFGLILVCHGNIYRGDGVVVMPRFDVQEMLEAIDRFRLARLYLLQMWNDRKLATPTDELIGQIPPLIHAMIKTPNLLSRYDLSSVSTIVVGAASLSAATVETLARLQPTWNILQGYGLTEAAVVVACTASFDIEFGSCGSLYPGYEARLIDPDGNEINEYNEPGELLVRSPTVMLGYLGDDTVTRENLTADGWLRTGDLVIMKKSRNGHTHIYIVDRVKELIKVQVRFDMFPYHTSSKTDPSCCIGPSSCSRRTGSTTQTASRRRRRIRRPS